MRVTLISGTKTLLALVASVLVVLALVDAGSIGLTRLTFPDDVRRAGQLDTAAADDRPATRETARLAFDAARGEGRLQGINVTSRRFTLYPDGRVTIGASRTAPTVLLDRIEMLRDYAVVRTTLTVQPSPY